MAEQLAFQQRFGNGGAVDPHIAGVRAPTETVQRACHQLFAGAAFAQNQHARVGWPDGLDQLPQLAHFQALTDNFLEAVGFAGACAEAGVLLQEPVPLGAAGDGVEEFFRRKRLGQIVNRARLDGLDRELGCGEGRDHQHGQVRPALFQLAEEFVAAHAIESRISDDHEEFLLFEQAQGFFGRLDCPHRIALVLQHGL